MKYLNVCRRYGAKASTKVSAVVAGLALTMAQAHAALPSALTDGFTTLEADAKSLMDLVWPVLLTVAFGFALFRLSKRGVRASS